MCCKEINGYHRTTIYGSNFLCVTHSATVKQDDIPAYTEQSYDFMST